MPADARHKIPHEASGLRARLVLLLGQRDGEREHVVGREARVDDADALVTANQQARADEQHHRERHFADDERFADARAAGPDRAASGGRGESRDGAAGRRERGHEAEHHAGQDRNRHREGEHAPVDADLSQPRNAGRSERDQRARAPVGDDEPRDSAGHAEHDALGQELLHEPPASGAERRPHGHLARAAVRPREQEVGDVDARDEQHERDRAEQDQQRRPDAAHDPILQTHRGHHAILVGARKVARETLGHDGHRAIRAVEADRWFQPGNRADPLRTARVVGDVRGLEDQRPPVVGTQRHVQIRRRDADDRERLAVHPQRRADQIRPRAELAAPQPVAEDDDGRAAVSAVGVDEPAPQAWHDTEDVEERRRDVGAVDELRIARAREVRGRWGDGRRAGEDAALCRDVQVVRRRKRHRQASVAAVEQLHETSGLVIRQRPQQHTVDDGEDGGVGADAEREGQRRDERESRLAPQHARGVADVLEDRSSLHHSFADRAEGRLRSVRLHADRQAG